MAFLFAIASNSEGIEGRIPEPATPRAALLKKDLLFIIVGLIQNIKLFLFYLPFIKCEGLNVDLIPSAGSPPGSPGMQNMFSG